MSRKNHYFSYFRHFWQAGADLLFPPHCEKCDQGEGPFVVPTLCEKCWQGVYAPLQLSSMIWAGGPYEGHLKTLIGRAKFQADPLAIVPLKRLILELGQTATQSTKPDLILSIPGSPERIRKRGINLPDGLAKHVKRKLKIPYEKSYFQRINHTVSQQGLTEKARQKNVKGCFEASPQLKDRNILLIEDVTTTGATLNEAIETLKRQNPTSIKCLVLAKTL